MSKHNQNSSHELHIRMEMADDGGVKFFISPDNTIYKTLHMTPNEMAANNAPASVIGIRILYHMCCNEVVKEALDAAFEIQRRVSKSDTDNPDHELHDLPPDLVLH